ncbi:hypothetical protein NKH17_28440 [Mesorhizobium sp. M1334]
MSPSRRRYEAHNTLSKFKLAFVRSAENLTPFQLRAHRVNHWLGLVTQ